jgi:hypothetical protein
MENEIGIGPAKCGSRLQSGLLDCVCGLGWSDNNQLDGIPIIAQQAACNLTTDHWLAKVASTRMWP